ncbi:MAG: glycosyltransferase [Candidatus Micrarchaeota archaeon]
MDLAVAFEYGLAFLTIFVTVFFLLVLLENRGELNRRLALPRRLPLVSIIIPAFNEEESIEATIESALAADYPRKQIIVVDDGSTDGTLRIARRFARCGVLVLHQPNRGKGAALNLGLGHARGELVATLDSDSFLEKDSLRKMLPFFSNPRVGAVTSVMKVHEPRTPLQRLQRLEYLVTVFNRRLLSFINAINVTPGPLSMFRRKVFDKVGRYDERNILEDQEMALRIQAADYEIASSMDAVVYTRVPSTLQQLTRQRVRWHRGGIRNMLKHYYLVNPRYGDFGLFVMPLGIFSVFALFAVFAVAISALLSGSPFLQYGLDAVFYSLTPLHFLSAIIFVGTVGWAYVGVKSIEGEGVNPVELMAYVLLYAPLITLFWVVTVFKELKREKLRW